MTMASGQHDASFDPIGYPHKQLTATERVGSVVCRITLERDDSGCYREVDLTPIRLSGDGASAVR